MPLPLKIGDHVRQIESQQTSNWTRIDIGRTGRVVGYHTYSFRQEHGPRVLIRLRFDEPRKWDSKSSDPIFTSPCQLEILEA